MSKESKYSEEEDLESYEEIDSEALKIIKEEMALESEYVVLENCVSAKFINELYNILRQNDNCFLEGAFVISDQDGKLFDKLTKTCLPNNYRGSFGGITHDIFLNETKFNKLKLGRATLDSQFLQNKLLYFPNDKVFRFFQFENPIQDQTKKNIELTYLCDPECQKNQDNKRCIQSRKSVKRVMLFYPFQTIDLLNKSVKRYLYFKLESSKAISTQHTREAIIAYVNPPTKNDSGYPFRRERVTNDENNRYKTELRIADAKFYRKIPNIDVEEIRYYNHFVRSNDELYIPQVITNKILKDL